MWEAAAERARARDLLWVAGPVFALFAASSLFGAGRRAIIAWLAMFAAMAILSLWWARRRAPRDPWTPGPRGLVVDFGVGLVAVGALMFYSALFMSFGEVETPEATRVLGEGARGGGGFARILLIVAVTLGPIGEELFFRGFLMHALARWIGRWLALGAQAVLFALTHGYDLAGTMSLVMIGLLFGAIVMWRRGLVAAIVAHIGVNAYVAFSAGTAPPRPIIGVHCEREPGCRIAVVRDGTPAAEQGLRVGDRITTFEGFTVESPEALIELATRLGRPGQLVELVVERDGQTTQVLLRLGGTYE